MLIGYDELKKHFGGTTAAEVAARAEGEGVKCLPGKQGKPFTSMDAINHALGVPLREYHPNTEHQPREIEVP